MAEKRERIVTRLIEDEMRESFIDYSMSVIVQRALPDVRDGLKPVHRRILYSMLGLGLLPERPHKKSATVVGDVLGKYHPHGDTAVYDALVRMVQDFSLRYPLVAGQGNFGSIDGDSAAAYRYTEAKLSAVAMQLLADIDQATVDFTPNFDSRLEEPVVLPARFPNLLVNGSSGIAVGMSTNVPPHNLREIARGVKQLVVDPECSIADLMRHIPGPDFPTGGFIVGREGIKDMYRNGRGRVVMRARVVKESLRGGKDQLVVTEIPYATSKTKIIEQIVDLARKGKLDEVGDVRDESDRDGIRLVIELKRGASAKKTLASLYQRTSLQSTFGAILLALDGGEPKEFNLKTMLERFRDHRIHVIVRRSQYRLEQAEAEKHIIEGLLAALKDIDAVIKIIRAARDRAEASEKLQDRLGLSDAQADAILNMRLGKLTRLEQTELKARLAELEAQITELRALLKSPERQLELMLEELSEVVAAFGDERRTEILADADQEVTEVESEAADEDVVVLVSHQGFVQRMPMQLYRRRVVSGKALAGMEKHDEDYIERLFAARTRGWILAFTAGGHCHFLPVLDLPESGRASRGQSVYSLLSGADRRDRIVAMLPVDDLAQERVLVFLTRKGLVKRTPLQEFGNPRSGGVIAMGVREADEVFDVALSDGRAELMILTREGRAIRFPERDVPEVGRTAQGVKGVALEDEDGVVGMVVIRRIESAHVLTVSEDGLGKRTLISEFPLQKRGGMGNLVTASGKDVRPLIGAMEVVEKDEVMLVTAGGLVVRVPAARIPVQGRRTQGGRLARLGSGDRLVEMTRVAAGTGGPGDAEAEPAGVPRDADEGSAEPESEDQSDLFG
ncbi:MAG: DNA gyrase subunit A [Gemmatimonadetes bacterium]|nr:DNA gyrase subunit A [Gemmatimonadota bacterium]